MTISSKIFQLIDYPVYTGAQLGLTYTKHAALFRVWVPTASAVHLLLYREQTGGKALDCLAMQSGENGTWQLELPGDWINSYYTYQAKINNHWNMEVADPYAKAVGVNGTRAMVIELAATNPAGWENDFSPAFSPHNLTTDAIIYELHTRDFSMHPGSGIVQKGKFGGLSETGTTNGNGDKTGLDHLKELGVTHIHLLPVFDFNGVDEGDAGGMQYSWGYDPLHYNVPEGSYSSNPFDGITRIKELKQLVATLHSHGLRVVMDVVYSHTALTETSAFNQLVPGYYYRHWEDGKFSDASSCGNETASERPMMRQFMLESLQYWVKEFHMDGFRFDLMGVHDIETMNEIARSLRLIKKDILLYGEGWTAAESPLPGSLRALKKNVSAMNGIAVFSDEIRDGIKGSVFDFAATGFVSGNKALIASVKFGIVAGCRHPQVDYRLVNHVKKPYAISPANTITYSDCHDNHNLWDKLEISNPGVNKTDRESMHRLALTIVLTSQGIPFLHAGSEFMRTKYGVENSYKCSDAINAINWELKTENQDLCNYVANLVQMRKAHPAFRMTTASEVSDFIVFDDQSPEGTIVYSINGAAMEDSWKTIRLIFNGTGIRQLFDMPPGEWKNALPGEPINGQHRERVMVEKYNAAILYQV